MAPRAKPAPKPSVLWFDELQKDADERARTERVIHYACESKGDAKVERELRAKRSASDR